MTAECSACAPQPPRARRAAPWLGVASGLGALLLPKCPLCVTAWLSLLGIGLGTASVMASLLPVVGATLFATGILTLWLRLHRV